MVSDASVGAPRSGSQADRELAAVLGRGKWPGKQGRARLLRFRQFATGKRAAVAAAGVASGADITPTVAMEVSEFLTVVGAETSPGSSR
ncbi:MAG: hypothetical protein KDI53_17890, partial [Candidatus Accumulibacter sp.]|nr:hypothetical protein [Accumulibacter sp.]